MTTVAHRLGASIYLMALTSLAACSSSKKDDPTPPPATTGMSWTADGAALTTSTLQSQKFSTTISVAGTIPANTKPIYLSLEFPNAVGTYPFSPSSAASASYTVGGSSPVAYYAGANPGAGTATGAGTIVVTALTATSITGTFTFTGISANSGDSKSITNGRFNVGL